MNFLSCDAYPILNNVDPVYAAKPKCNDCHGWNRKMWNTKHL